MQLLRLSGRIAELRSLADMNTKLLATIVRWTARVLGIVLVGLTLFIAIGGAIPNPFAQPVVIQIGFLALALVLFGIFFAWRWELSGSISSLIWLSEPRGAIEGETA
jgi:hypothetical protein